MMIIIIIASNEDVVVFFIPPARGKLRGKGEDSRYGELH